MIITQTLKGTCLFAGHVADKEIKTKKYVDI